MSFEQAKKLADALGLDLRRESSGYSVKALQFGDSARTQLDNLEAVEAYLLDAVKYRNELAKQRLFIK